MHELGLTQEVISVVNDRINSRSGSTVQVKRVILEIGKLSAVLPHSVQFCFEVCSKGTPLEGAELLIIETPGRARCQECSLEFQIEEITGRCPCGSSNLKWLAGHELKVKEVEVH